MCNNNLAAPQRNFETSFSFEKADMVEGLPGVQVQS
jgi:hypothetical protein